MNNEFEIDFRGDHIHVELGENYSSDLQSREHFWNEIRALCEKHNTKRVLVEGFTPAGERKTGDIIDAGLQTSAVPKLWLAFHLDDHQRTEGTELFEAVAASRGVRVKFFADTEHALMWLRNNTPS